MSYIYLILNTLGWQWFIFIKIKFYTEGSVFKVVLFMLLCLSFSILLRLQECSSKWCQNVLPKLNIQYIKIAIFNSLADASLLAVFFLYSYKQYLKHFGSWDITTNRWNTLWKFISVLGKRNLKINSRSTYCNNTFSRAFSCISQSSLSDGNSTAVIMWQWSSIELLSLDHKMWLKVWNKLVSTFGWDFLS